MKAISTLAACVASSLAVVSAASPGALAADLGGRYAPPPVEPAYSAAPEPFWNWTGLYFGGNVGYGFSGADLKSLERTSHPLK